MPFPCEERCKICEAPHIKGCWNCTKIKTPSSEINYDYYYRVIDQILFFDIKEITFHGGDLNKYFKKIIPLLEYINTTKKININIILPLSTEDNYEINYLKYPNVKLICNILYSPSPKKNW